MIRSIVGATLVCIFWASQADAAVSELSPGLAVEQMNERLQGMIATIDLADGSTVKKAKRVVIEPHFTYWTERGAERKVATDQIIRISARPKSKGWVGLGVGAGIGILSIASSSDSSAGGEDLVAAANSGAIALSAVASALVGYGIDKAIPRKSELVFEVDSVAPVGPPRKNSKRS